MDITRKDEPKDDPNKPDASQKLTLEFDGAEVINLSSVDAKGVKTPIPPTKGAYEIVGSPTLIADLRNLHPTVAVKLSLRNAEKPFAYEFKVVLEESDVKAEAEKK